MYNNKYTRKSVRRLIDKFFSLQWCRDNLVVPLYQETSLRMSPGVIKIAIANYSYLRTIASPIKERLNQSGFKCEFVERSQEDIQEILDLASEERFISEGSIEISEIDEDSVLETIRDVSESEDAFKFEFDKDIDDNDNDNDNEDKDKESGNDNYEDYLEEQIIDLEIEMSFSKIQEAAGKVLIYARKNDLSDIHIDPREEGYKIRVRKDGVMQPFMVLARKPGIQLVACLKNMAKMDIAERRAIQDGKILRLLEGNRLEFRCATVPGKYGEKMVLRMLNSDSSALNLDTLIHIESVRKDFRKIMNAKNGVVIVSGPTGSGKSTTLAAALREKDTGDLNIFTAEDPIEYDMGGDIQQVQVNRAKGQTFAMILTAFLRHDPDVILIGETRDPETAEASLDAADTGHLVFTTLHANSSTSSLTRLLDMDVPKYKLNASVRGVLAQRLLRKVCKECGIKRPVSESEAVEFNIKENTPIMYANCLSAEEKLNRKRENTLCQRCQGSGYKGRIGAYELLLLDKKIQNAISKGLTDKEVEQIAVNENSMLTLSQYGVELVKENLTTISEVIRVCKLD